MRTRAIVLVAVLAAVVAVGVAAFLRPDDESSSSTTTPEAPEPVACDTLPGRPVDEVVGELGMCQDASGALVGIAWTERQCTDGRTVVWADLGWGFRGDVWQVHARPDGQRVPPDEVLALCPG